jgi:hypothetical protein
VAPGGDVNGDGRPDLIVGVPGFYEGEQQALGAAFVLLRPPRAGTVDLTDLGPDGFGIYYRGSDRAIAGATVDGGGDFNGDGLDDVLVAAPRAADGTGSAYVVFGSRAPRDVDLSQLAEDGLEIHGGSPADPDDGTCDSGCALSPGSNVGSDAAFAGDVNRDGLDDVIVAARPVGMVAVVFGRASGGRVSFLEPGGGFLIDRLASHARAENDFMPVAGPGDVNGDGRSDLLIGADPTWDGACGRCTGNAYLVFGKSSRTTVHVDRLGARGLRIKGQRRREGLGYDVAGPGDVNGDGRPDLLIGSGGSAVVVFGSDRTGELHTERLGRRGFRLTGTGIAEVDPVGDWNRDGLADLAVGRRLVLGKRSARTVAVDESFRGFALTNRDSCLGRRGDCPGSFFDERPYQLRGAGDLDADGRADLIYGDPGTAPRERGAAYVLFGAGPPLAAVVEDGGRWPAPAEITAKAAGQVSVRVLCPANAFRACTGSLRLTTRAGDRRLFARRFHATAGRSAVVTGRLPLAFRNRLRMRHQLDITARVRARDPRGRRAATATDLTVLPPATGPRP